jgi:soluble lytic murein transglycosylase-like protein
MAAFCFLAAAVLAMTEATTRGAETGTGSVPSGAQAAAPAPRVKSVVRVDAQTGRLVRVFVPMKTPAPATRKPVPRTAPDPAIQTLVEKTARDYNVSPALVDSVISVESGFNPSAVSWKGAQGIMQLMPATARRFGVSDAFDVKQNLEGGVRYLRFLQDTFKDDKLAIAAYNAGEGAVAKYNGVPPYRETVDYVKKVGERYEQARENEESGKTAAGAPVVAQPPPQDQHPRLVSYVDERGQLHIATEQ